jgi:hypothetical protein
MALRVLEHSRGISSKCFGQGQVLVQVVFSKTVKAERSQDLIAGYQQGNDQALIQIYRRARNLEAGGAAERGIEDQTVPGLDRPSVQTIIDIDRGRENLISPASRSSRARVPVLYTCQMGTSLTTS